ncbi:MAG: hypothetical protein J5798_01230 [Spirochaetaceae bacterium]|nr:hypothetical protein [Spirochaetaceae bacterium]
MAFSIKILTLYKDLNFSTDSNIETDKNERLEIYKNGVSKHNMSPALDEYLKDGIEYGFALPKDSTAKADYAIKAGKYFFVQGDLKKDNINEAAEALWLESIWQEQTLDMDTVYVRYINEDNHEAFQIFRKVAAN